MQGKKTPEVRDFCINGKILYIREDGRPISWDWAEEYNGKADVIYVHNPVEKAIWKNNTIDIDTGCVYNGMLTAIQYPEKKIIQVEGSDFWLNNRNIVTP
jgi:protein phosphatase